MKPRLKHHYEDRVRPRLSEQFGYRNPMSVPKLEKIVLNVGLGEASRNAKLLDSVVEEMTSISGQKPVAASCGS